MIGLTALSARLGASLEHTLCTEVALRVGRPAAVITGVSLFLVAACFQFGNNLGVIAAIEPIFEIKGNEGLLRFLPQVLIVSLNAFIIAVLLTSRALYTPIERLMKLMVGLMMLGFAGNLLMAKPDLLKIVGGLIPQLPPEAADSILPRWQPAVVEQGQVVQAGKVIDHLVPVTALFATTASIAGAFYQSYLVREKGWTLQQVRNGLIDSVVGISMLGLISLMIMVTAASVLHGDAQQAQLESISDVARQLEPAFGPFAKWLFCLGIFAGAFSSFLVNAMIGGCILSDGLGLGGSIDQRWPKAFTVLGLLVGMCVTLYIQTTGQRPLRLIIFAQAMTVLAIPVLALVLAALASARELTGERRIPVWMKAVAYLGLACSIFLALRTAMNLLLPTIYGG